jgi:hypothetical protein
MWLWIARSSGAALVLGSALWLSACQAHSLSGALGTHASTTSTSPGSSASAASSSSTPSSTSSSTDNCPSSGDLPGARPESYTGSNNSPLAARTDPEPTDCEIARENHHKWTRLVGYTVEEATQRAKAAAWKGEVEVRQLSEFDPGCKDGMVCSLAPARWEIGEGHKLTLYVNRKIAIATPD